MNHKWSVWWVGGPVLVALGVGGVLAGRSWRAARDAELLQGQAATYERLVETPTGGQPHYDAIQYRAKDSRAAIMEPRFVDARDVPFAAGTMGIGVAVGNESRFYPLFVMQYHQVVNDECGDKPIACSY
jgi:hypothetical protein